MNLFDLPRTPEESRRFLRTHNILKDIDCCGQPCYLIKDEKNSDGVIYKCNICSKKHSIRKNSFFSGSNLSLSKLITIVFLFATKVNVTTAGKLLANTVSVKSIVQWYKFLREVCSVYLMRNNDRLGGPNPVYISEMDETMLGGKRKYNRGYIRGRQQWLFAAIDRQSRKCKMRLVPNRTRQTLAPIIRTWVRQGSTIHTDQARVYANLNTMNFRHCTVCHKENFVDPNDGTHTNIVENLFSNLKSELKHMRGTKSDLAGHIDEFVYRWNRTKGAQHGDLFLFLLEDISSVY